MRIELEVAGYDVHFVSINKDDAVDSQEEIVKRCAFPQLQDTPELGLWGRFDGRKDDFYIFDAEGKLRTYLPFNGGAIKTILSEEADYQAVKGALLDVIEPRDPGPEPDPADTPTTPTDTTTDPSESDATAPDTPAESDANADANAAPDPGDTEGDVITTPDASTGDAAAPEAPSSDVGPDAEDEAD